MNFIGYRTLKTGISAAIAMLIAGCFDLKYAAAAGVIAILSMQNTKKQSVRFAGQRLGACVIALFLASVLFKFIGYNPIVFGVFLWIFIPLCAKLKLHEGIVVSSVLVTHLLAERTIGPAILINELSLMLIGIGTALFLNLYMPSFEAKIKKEQILIEENIKSILHGMAVGLREQVVSIKEEELFNMLEKRLNGGRDIAYKNYNNSFFANNNYYLSYMEMRLQQLRCLKNMRRHFERFSITYKQTILIADFTEKVAVSMQENNTAEGLLTDLIQLRRSFTMMELPQNREEFENRAMLYQFLNDLEEFLQIKYEFKESFK